MQVAAKELDNLPLQFSGWKAEVVELGESERKQTGTVGWYNVGLRNDKTGAQASIMLLCGQTRPLSVHPPTVCFQGMGLEVAGKEQRVQVGSPDGETSWGSFMTADFRPTGEKSAHALRTYWAWSRDGKTWEAPELPRFNFSGAPYLYKIYVSRQIAASELNASGEKRNTTGPAETRTPSDKELCEAILQNFLPELQQVITPKL
ncbi:MAG: hypothetical protein NT069_23610 [Planctomycetota bacterium]|nr:hypothetical protein [Planctomycetota bacterium]